jgi:hypothetical protein
MKKLFSVFIIIIILLCVTCVILSYQILDSQNRISELQAEIREQDAQLEELSNLVEITGLLKYGWNNPGGMLMISTVNVTIANFGRNTVSGLSLLVKDVSDFKTGNWSDTKTLHVGAINPREIRTISTEINWSLGSKGNTTATLMLGNEILDVYTISR